MSPLAASAPREAQPFLPDSEARVLSKMFRLLAMVEIGTGRGEVTRALARQASLVVTLGRRGHVRFLERNIIPLRRQEARRQAMRYQGAVINAHAASTAETIAADIALARELVTFTPKLVVVRGFASEAVRAGVAPYPYQWMRTENGLGILRLYGETI